MSKARAIIFSALLAATFGFAQDNPGNGVPGRSSVGNTNQNSIEQPITRAINQSEDAAPPATATNDPERDRKQSDASLPQTATILPLLGLVGLSSLVTGFIFRQR